MQSEPDLLIKNASLDGDAATVDIGIADGLIASIEADISADANQVIDAEGNFVSPGLVDCHLHIDRAFSSVGERKPVGWEQSATAKDYNQLFNEYYENISAAELERKATKNVRRAAKYGTTHMRSHVAVDHPSGLTNMDACLETYENTAEIMDLQLAVMPSKGIVNDESFDLVEEAVYRGVERTSSDSILVGGVDPASANHDVDEAITRWFDIATTYDVGIDVHIQDGGMVGIYTLEKLIEKTREYDYEGKVTASHCFSLAHIPEFRLEDLMEKMQAVDLKLVTCYSSTRATMPVRTLLTNDVPLGHGTDNDRDFVALHGHCDTLGAAMIQSVKLHGDKQYSRGVGVLQDPDRDRDLDEEYRWFQTNEGLAMLWDMITDQGSIVMDTTDSYGLEVGTPADIVIFDEPSAQWSIIRKATRRHVIKNGTVIAEDEQLLPEYAG